MKKILLGLFVMFVCLLSVDASVSGDYEIKLDGIKLTSNSTVTFDGILEVKYELTPKDADNKDLTWSISGLKTGITAKFVDGNKTNASTGTVKVEFKNTLDEVVKVTITATDSTKKIVKSVEVSVQNEQKTIELKNMAKEIEDLIKDLPESVTKKNYSSVEDKLGQIDSLFNDNEGVENFVDEDLNQKYEAMVEEFDKYNESSSMTITLGTIITIALLVISFIFGLFVIFKKEEK